MLSVQRITGTSGAETLGLFALLGALGVCGLAIQQLASDGIAVLGHAAWWLRFGLAEAAFLLVLAVAWRRMSRRRPFDGVGP